MIKQDIINYVMNTPYNTNRAVLQSMLNNLENSLDNNLEVVTITLKNNSSGDISLLMPCFFDIDSTTYFGIWDEQISENTSIEIETVVKKDISTNLMFFSEDSEFTASSEDDNIIISSNKAYINGEGVITFTDK